MWKCMSRRFRDAFERSANHFERSTTNVANNINEEKKRSGPPCQWFMSRHSWDSFGDDKNDTTNIVNNIKDERKRSGPPCQWFTSRRGWDSFGDHKNDTTNVANNINEERKRSGPPGQWFTSRRGWGSFGDHKYDPTNVVNNSIEEKKWSGPPCQRFRSRRCWDSFRDDKNDTNRKKWNFDHMNRSWMCAITWSSAIVTGWYTSQLIQLKLKKKRPIQDIKTYVSINNIAAILQPYIAKCGPIKEKRLKPAPQLESIIEGFTPTVHLVTNENSGVKTNSSSGNSSSSSSNSSDDLGEVLNSIENRLGLAAIERGQHDMGLHLLRSAANRHHAPALYNLGLCYESGMGVPLDEKTAAEFYKSAAALDHPGALFNLGIYYGQGRGGLKRDIETATRLLRLAAVQGQQDAITALKHLEIDITPPQVDVDTWTARHNTPMIPHDYSVPTQSALFVENLIFTNPNTQAPVF